MRKIDSFFIMLLSLLLVGCSGSDSSVNPEPEPPTTGENTNANDPVEGKSFVTDYSMPHLNPENYYVEHTVTYDGKKTKRLHRRMSVGRMMHGLRTWNCREAGVPKKATTRVTGSIKGTCAHLKIGSIQKMPMRRLSITVT